MPVGIPTAPPNAAQIWQDDETKINTKSEKLRDSTLAELRTQHKKTEQIRDDYVK